MKEKNHHTRCGTIHYWASVSNQDAITLVFLPGLTADHRLFVNGKPHTWSKKSAVFSGGEY